METDQKNNKPNKKEQDVHTSEWKTVPRAGLSLTPIVEKSWIMRTAIVIRGLCQGKQC